MGKCTFAMLLTLMLIKSKFAVNRHHSSDYINITSINSYLETFTVNFHGLFSLKVFRRCIERTRAIELNEL